MGRAAAGTGPAPTRVFILSGHPAVRQGLADLLRDEGFEVVGEVGSITAAVPAAAAAAADVALLGDRLVDGTGIEACRALHEAAPGTRCIIMATHDGPGALRASALAGAAGYVLQSARTEGLIQAIRRVAAGAQLPSAWPAQALYHDPEADALLAGAPGHERAIWSLLRQGRTDSQARAELGLPPQAFSARLSALLARLGYLPAPHPEDGLRPGLPAAGAGGPARNWTGNWTGTEPAAGIGRGRSGRSAGRGEDVRAMSSAGRGGADPVGAPPSRAARPDPGPRVAAAPPEGPHEEGLHQGPGLGGVLQDLVLDSPDVEEFLADLAALAASELSTDSNPVVCGVTVLRGRKGSTAASSSALGRELDRLQNSFGDGPCLAALRERTVVHVPDTLADPRWRPYLDAAAREGVGSVLAVALDLGGEAEAVMNLYSRASCGFSGPDISAAVGFAGAAARSLRLALRLARLRQSRDDLVAAMRSRTTIDMAIGVIMAQNRCGRDAAFKVLTAASNHRNVKLREVAAGVVAAVSGERDFSVRFKE